MKRFLISEAPLNNLKLDERHPILDDRGFLTRMFCSEELNSVGWNKPFREINHTLSKKRGTVRGLCFQHLPYTEMKLVYCIRGEIWDVAVWGALLGFGLWLTHSIY